MLLVESFAPRSAPWHELLDDRESELLAVLAQGYGAANRGDAVHHDRLHTTKPWIIIASLVTAGRMIACSYVQRSGKRAAMAVLPDFRGQGVARALIRRSLADLPDQWVEIGAGDTVHERRYRRAGFGSVSSWQHACGLLGPLLVPLVTAHSYRADGSLTYSRHAFTPPRTEHHFVIMIHGSPADRVANDGLNYLVDEA
jgi:GNAT superfamily N-acetyltransferase